MKWFINLLNTVFSFIFSGPKGPGEQPENIININDHRPHDRWEKTAHDDHRDVA